MLVLIFKGPLSGCPFRKNSVLPARDLETAKNLSFPLETEFELSVTTIFLKTCYALPNSRGLFPTAVPSSHYVWRLQGFIPKKTTLVLTNE
jgi:hypothetical protein